MIRKLFLLVVFVYAVGAVSNYNSYLTQFANGKEPTTESKIAAGVAAAMWPVFTELPEILGLAGIDIPAIDLSQINWIQVLIGYLVLSYTLGFSVIRWACHDEIAKYKAMSYDEQKKNANNLGITAFYLMSPIAVPLCLAWRQISKGVEPKRSK